MPDVSVRLLGRFAPPPAPVVDVGAGRSRLADALLAAGWDDLTLLDISATALADVRNRLGAAGARVQSVTADVTAWSPARTYGAWHDRAVFHFLTDPADRDRYIRTAARAVAPAGVLVIATFAPDGPERCSGLPVARYGAGALADHFGGAFAPLHAEREVHRTPSGTAQPFTWAVLRRRPAAQGDPRPGP